METPAAESESLIAHPPRFWWLRRLGLGGALFLLVLLLLRLWWGYEAQRRLDAEIAAAHARGEPVLIEDFDDPPAPPDEENAAALLTQAGASITYNAAQRDFDNRFDTDTARTPADEQMIAGMVAANSGAIDLARKAAQVQTVNWQVHLHSPVISTLLSFSNAGHQRDLAHLLNYGVIVEHQSGEDSKAIADIATIFRIAAACERQPPWMLTHLESLSIGAVANSIIYRCADAIAITQHSPEKGDGAPHPASREEVLSLIKMILDEHEITAGGERACYGERLIGLDSAASMGPFMGTPSDFPLLIWMIRPMLVLDGVHEARIMELRAAAISQPTLAAAHARIIPWKRGVASPIRNTAHILLHNLAFFGGDRLLDRHYSVLTERRIAAVLLAMRLYQADHGQYPQSLDLLVPDYLPAVPTDPFSADAHPLRYVASPGSERIYSVGENGVDDGGVITARPAGFTANPWKAKDFVVPVHPPALNPPATEPSLDQ